MNGFDWVNAVNYQKVVVGRMWCGLVYKWAWGWTMVDWIGVLGGVYVIIKIGSFGLFDYHKDQKCKIPKFRG